MMTFQCAYAEVKSLATDNSHIKEKMDLEVQVSKLKLLKSNYLSMRYFFFPLWKRSETFILYFSLSLLRSPPRPYPMCLPCSPVRTPHENLSSIGFSVVCVFLNLLPSGRVITLLPFSTSVGNVAIHYLSKKHNQ